MGTYIYSVRRKLIVVEFEGHTEHAAVMSYLLKPSYGFMKTRPMAIQEAQIERAHKVWDGKPKPKLVVFAHNKPEAGDKVFEWVPPHRATWNDNYAIEKTIGPQVGTLVRTKRGHPWLVARGR